MAGERTGNIPVGNNRGRGQVSFWGLSEHRAAEKREAQVKEVQREN